nr:hypothetical protein [uncultured Albidiferax sp.]
MTLRNSWFIGEALQALARNLKAAAAFDRADLVKWTPGIAARPRAAGTALEHLKVLGFIAYVPRPEQRPSVKGQVFYGITPDGIEAAKTAQAEALRQVRAKAALQMSDRTRASSDFAARLWALVRMRKTLTAQDAAELLTDAGNDVAKAKAQASTYLLTWSTAFPDALQVSAKRFGGFKRYVLLRDLGPSVPMVGIQATATKRRATA